jgi:hypothetical protein
VTRTQVNADLDTIDERFAQSGIRLVRPVDIDMGGSGDPGVVLPGVLLDGVDAANEDPLVNPTVDEDALIAYKDTDVNTIDILYVLDLTVGGGPVHALAYYPSANGTGDDAYQNFFIVSGNRYYTLDIPHEILHILLNSGHRPGEPLTAIFHPDPVLGKPVNGPKRVGPYPGAPFPTGLGSDDTFVIRPIAEALHQ